MRRILKDLRLLAFPFVVFFGGELGRAPGSSCHASTGILRVYTKVQVARYGTIPVGFGKFVYGDIDSSERIDL